MEFLLRAPEDDRSMSGVSQILSRSRKTRDPSSLIQWSSSPPPPHPCHAPWSPHCFHRYERQPQSLPGTPPVTVLSRSSSLPSSLFHHPSSACTGAKADFPGAAQQQHDRNNALTGTSQRNRKIHAAADEENSVEVTIVKANGNTETKKLVSGSKKAFSTSTRYDKAMGSYRKQQVACGAANVAPCLNRSLSSPIDAKNPAAKAEFEDEKWAGPAYSKSPPPSSLPFPKFSVPVRSLSMEVAFSNSGGSPSEDIDVAGSNLASPSPQAPCNCWDAAFATKDLKRILNLDQQVAT
ncbi:uncharacterized protein LOC9645012 [Selaginella moellendorffii]|uniref:uncharacterized protein LOC9645012 n=1 Tax=Selaginella moellendorffii TaxID=88036 RepID=UPI000D1CBBF9|nr:uncharacterized protein LOC9645012 [Selaginella moellendorffii]|eukprot:XP_024545014.1 uncharacterized protein LOC9645012 [Selaginella moellendorffii]